MLGRWVEDPPEAERDELPIDEWSCDDCEAGIGWTTYDTWRRNAAGFEYETIGMHWTQLLELKDGRRLCEDCGMHAEQQQTSLT